MTTNKKYLQLIFFQNASQIVTHLTSFQKKKMTKTIPNTWRELSNWHSNDCHDPSLRPNVKWPHWMEWSLSFAWASKNNWRKIAQIQMEQACCWRLENGFGQFVVLNLRRICAECEACISSFAAQNVSKESKLENQTFRNSFLDQLRLVCKLRIFLTGLKI